MTTKIPVNTIPRTLRAALLKKVTSDLYTLQSQRKDAPTFILHDGPPYANGALHLGHALNKILKDIVNRVQILDGKRVVFIPGWDCHGLPIELKALQQKHGVKPADPLKNPTAAAVEMGKSMTALEIRSMARELAQGTIGEQMKEFQQWAVMADWEGKYVTMDKDYEILQLQVFREMVKRGLVYRRFRPVYWSPSSGSALAEAELEYNPQHVSKAAFIKFPVLGQVAGEDGVSAVIWTTTPWTIPANKAVAVGSDMEYCIVQSASHGKLLVAKERLEYLGTVVEGDLRIIKSKILGKDLVGLCYTHPLLPADVLAHPIISADFVSADSGTGLVHLAPGHGMDDYLVCLTHNIAPFSPVDNNGCYTTDTLPELHGKEVLYGGTKAVLELLKSSGALLHLQKKFLHKYPCDWRTKRPVIVRATAQWFADAESIKADAVSALEDVRFIPETGKGRLAAFVKGRSEWCISRQRAWGVPIPALYDTATGEPLLTESSVDHIISVLKTHGTDSWFSPDVADELFVAPEYTGNGKTYTRGKETMDVWFDSGTSWATLSSRLNTPVTADLYLEGTDQHRGWFQSSLITSIAARSSAPYKQVLTHGFVLDGSGRKMSKSLGNVISPTDVTTRHPHDVGISTPTRAHAAIQKVDILRLWVAHCDFTKDVTIGQTVLTHIHEVLRKARVTSRYCLGILNDWDGTYTPYSSLSAIDKLALAQLWGINESVRAALATYNFNKAVSLLTAYTSTELSAFYLDVIKDRVYSSLPSSPQRRAAQTVAAYILRNYLSLLSPIIPLLAAESWSHAPAALISSTPHEEREMLRFFSPQAEWDNHDLLSDFARLTVVHTAVKQCIERAKTAGQIKVNLETDVQVVVPPRGMARELVERYREDLEALWIVSGVEVVGEMEEMETRWRETESFMLFPGEWGAVRVRQAKGRKCVRCWVYKAPHEGGVCPRCVGVLKEMGVEGWS
ncbi:isoleucyl-tRNA synthetase [Wilcoxina mikolae CBS 423.85]|nr:isoleucyl-tRNA synthetase [Wilcoxina mikolae CBS 423.85]